MVNIFGSCLPRDAMHKHGLCYGAVSVNYIRVVYWNG